MPTKLPAEFCGTLDALSKFSELPIWLPHFSLHPSSCLHSPILLPSHNIINSASMSDTTKKDDATSPAAPLGLPAPSDVPASSSEPNNVIKLDHLGPMIVNSDGTISRIANWQNMSEIEKERSLRLLAKRNNARMKSLNVGQQQ